MKTTHRIRRALFVLLAVLLLAVPVFAADALELKADAVEASVAAGTTVEVPVRATANPGYAVGSVRVTWDSEALILTDITYTDLAPKGQSAAISNSGEYLIDFGNELATTNYSGTGVFFTLKFTVSDSAQEGEYAIGLVAGNGVFDTDIASVTLAQTSGSVTLVDTTPRYAVSFNANGGTGTVAAQTVKAGATFMLPENGFTAPAYSAFDHWEIGGTAYQPGISITVTGDLSVKAIWKHVHSVTRIPAKAATCTATGNIEYWTCSGCGKYFSDAAAATEISLADTVTPVIAHTAAAPVRENEVAAACETAGGYDEAVYCSVCGKELSRTHQTVPALGHDWGAGAVFIEPTCETAGTLLYTCRNNASHTKTEGIPALGHSWDAGVVTAEPSCEVPGVRTFTCTNDPSHTKTEEIPALGHSWNAGVVTAEPSCEVPGVRTFTCTNDPSHTKTEEVPALGHAWGEWTVTVPATEEAAGTEARTCARCGGTETRSVPSLTHMHSPVRTAAKAPTCTAAGNTEYWTCSGCGRYFSDAAAAAEIELADTVIPATGHIAAAPVRENEVAASCETAGGYDEVVYCSVCTEELSRIYQTVPALGHDWDAGTVTTEPSCGASGIRTYTCRNNSSHTKTEEIPALGHAWGEWSVTTPATEEAEGVETRTCSRCNETETRPIPMLTPSGGNTDTSSGSDDSSGSDSSGGSSGSGSGNGSAGGSGSEGTAGGDADSSNEAEAPEETPDGESTEADDTAAVLVDTEMIAEAASNKEDTLVVTVEDDHMSITSLEIASEALQAAADAGIALRVESAQGSVTLSAEAMEALAERDGEAVLRIETKEDGAYTVDVTVDGESADVKVKVELPATEDSLVMVLVREDGTEEIIKKSVVEEGKAYAELPAGATVKTADNRRGFSDVNASDWFSSAVDFVSSHDLFRGVSEDEFAPKSSMTRAMLVTVLFRLEDEPEGFVGTKFGDVNADSWYADAVAWASDAGLVQGNGDGFAPNDNVSREQIAVILYRYVRYLGIGTGAGEDVSRFRDGSEVSSWAKDAMAWAVEAGLFQGDDTGSLHPKAEASRADVATLLERLVKLIVK